MKRGSNKAVKKRPRTAPKRRNSGECATDYWTAYFPRKGVKKENEWDDGEERAWLRLTIDGFNVVYGRHGAGSRVVIWNRKRYRRGASCSGGRLHRGSNYTVLPFQFWARNGSVLLFQNLVHPLLSKIWQFLALFRKWTVKHPFAVLVSTDSRALHSNWERPEKMFEKACYFTPYTVTLLRRVSLLWAWSLALILEAKTYGIVKRVT